MSSLRCRFEFATRACIPLCGALSPRRDRSTHTDPPWRDWLRDPLDLARGRPSRLHSGQAAEPKTAIASRTYYHCCLKGMRVLPGQACQAKSFIFCVCPTPAMRARRGGRVCVSACPVGRNYRTGVANSIDHKNECSMQPATPK
jgi:hypothetical protein